ncbi:YlxM family DNA-binding protein [Butyrivibrio sp. VCD2006]|uniref:YlxM family DNA-binding protein n=1 Tax=Butyrivibrio sp. VCD2006 TaxID=1280664 RepID=UPI00041223A4|nr:sigma factor-like helix-turn-helix DNA-binding protein [Butyrivibrio sp. VCD2006]
MEKIVEQGLLYDFYGELLTDHQRKVYEDAVYNDLSLVEIAEEYDISKQGVHDLLKRCTNSLEGYEKRLHMIERTERIRHQLEKLAGAASDKKLKDEELRVTILRAVESITEELS